MLHLTPFGICSAEEVFQKRIQALLSYLPGMETDIDDILIWGTTKQEHKERLENMFKKCEEINLTLKKDKC